MVAVVELPSTNAPGGTVKVKIRLVEDTEPPLKVKVSSVSPALRVTVNGEVAELACTRKFPAPSVT
jgi:hypothetical protein